MTTITGSHPMQTARLDRTLEYAVVQSWDELMPYSTPGLLQIEYQTGPDGSIDYFTIWASTVRGHWNLVCEFWMKPLWGHATGLSFCGDYHSADFARTLKLVMGNQEAFSKLPHQQGTIQIYPPTQQERTAAERWMGVAFNHDGPMPMQQPVAA